MIVDTPMQRELARISNAKQAWDILEEKYNAKTLSMKLEHMQVALRTRFSRGTSVMQTKMEIEDALDAIFENGNGPTQEEWLTILVMNALSDEDYEWLKKDLLSFITNMNIKVSIKDIMTRIETDEREYKTNQGETAMAARTKKSGKRPDVVCHNCNKRGHMKAHCWAKGGGAEGQGPKKKGGQQAAAAQEQESGSEAAAVTREEECLSEWSCAATTELVAAATEQGQTFHLDSAATSHCSPFKSDFTSMVQIEPKNIRGVGGHIIKATARGTIDLTCESGEKLTLKNALYAPEAELRLISIGKLCDEGHTVSFDANGCKVGKEKGCAVVHGKRQGGKLYALSTRSTTCHEEAHVAGTSDSFEIWHQRLGHVGYDAIKKMAKDEMASDERTTS